MRQFETGDTLRLVRPVSADLPDGAEFRHILHWRHTVDFFEVRLGEEILQVHVISLDGGEPRAYLSRHHANLAGRRALNYWTGASENPKTWRRSKGWEQSPWTSRPERNRSLPNCS